MELFVIRDKIFEWDIEKANNNNNKNSNKKLVDQCVYYTPCIVSLL